MSKEQAKAALFLTLSPISAHATPALLLVWCSIYKGWLPTVLKVSTAQATRFGVFQVLKSSSYYGKDTPVKAAGAGAFAGATSVLLFQVRLAFGTITYILKKKLEMELVRMGNDIFARA